MEEDIERIRKEIYEKEKKYAQLNKKFRVKNVEYMGKIQLTEHVNSVDTKIVKDIFKAIEQMEDGTIVENYYDEQANFIAGRDQEGRMCFDKEARYENTDILEEIENLRENIEKNIKEAAEYIGIKKEEIISMSVIDLDQELQKVEKREENQEQENEEQITLTEDNEEEKDKETQKEKNEHALENIQVKQQINLDKKINNIYTLGQVLGVKPGAKLMAVYSSSIANNKNTTRFSFIIKNADGTLESPEMLNQVGGRDSNKNIYEVSVDGENVEKNSVQSTYEINSPITKNAIIAARISGAGYIDISYGEMDPTHHQDALTQELKTDRTKDVTYKVREEFNYNKGVNNIREDIEEVRKKTEKYGDEGLTLEDANGQEEDGIQDHLEEENSEQFEKNIIEKIKEDDEFKGYFTDKDIKETLEDTAKRNPDESLDEIEKITREVLMQYKQQFFREKGNN